MINFLFYHDLVSLLPPFAVWGSGGPRVADDFRRTERDAQHAKGTQQEVRRADGKTGNGALPRQSADRRKRAGCSGT